MVSLTNIVFANKTLCQALLLNKEIENVSFFSSGEGMGLQNLLHGIGMKGAMASRK